MLILVTIDKNASIRAVKNVSIQCQKSHFATNWMNLVRFAHPPQAENNGTME